MNLPVLSGDIGLKNYLEEIKKFPMLSAEEEYTLANRWQVHKDTNAAHQLVTSHLRLVAKIAMGYKGYGLPITDIISEGNIGLMQAAQKFDPEKGFRLTTYAMWWIKAAMQVFPFLFYILDHIRDLQLQDEISNLNELVFDEFYLFLIYIQSKIWWLEIRKEKS